MHQTFFSTYQPSTVWVVSNSKWKDESDLYKNEIHSLHSAIHKLAASAIRLWTTKTKMILVILVSYQISLILYNF